MTFAALRRVFGPVFLAAVLSLGVAIPLAQPALAQAAGTEVTCNPAEIILPSGGSKTFALDVEAKTCSVSSTAPAKGILIKIEDFGTQADLTLTPSSGNPVTRSCSLYGTFCSETFSFFGGTVSLSVSFGYDAADFNFRARVGLIAATIAGPPAPTLSYVTREGDIAYNTGSASATEIDVASLGNATGAPTGYYIGETGTATSGTSDGGGEVSITAAGVASYKPLAGFRGTDTFKVRAYNAGGESTVAVVTVRVASPTLDISLTGSGAVVNKPLTGYSLSVTGGKAPYTCNITPGYSLPFTINQNCTITGTPDGGGDYTFKVSVTDSSTGTGPFQAYSVDLTLAVDKLTPDFSFTDLKDGPLNSGFQLLKATTNSPGQVSFTTTTPDICAIDTSDPVKPNVNPLKIGICEVTASLASTSVYDGTTDTQSFQIKPANVIPDITPSVGSVSPAFNSETLEYTVKVPSSTTEMTFTLDFTATSVDISDTTSTIYTPLYEPGTTDRIYLDDETVITFSHKDSFDADKYYYVTITKQPAVIAAAGDAVPTISVNKPVTTFKPVNGSGGTGTLTYSISPDLPAGLSFDETTGEISGTPTAASAQIEYTITVKDSADTPETAIRKINLAVFATTPPTLSDVTRETDIAYNTGTADATPIDVAGLGSATGTPTAYYIGDTGTDTSGTSANGGEVSITTAGVASYTPKAGFRGTDTFKVRAQNADGTSDPATVTVTVADPTFTISLKGSGAKVATALYGYSISTTGGAADYSCTIATGSLPAGVSFGQALGQACSLIGTPTEAGDFTFTVNVTDSSTTPFTAASQSLTLAVAKGDQTISFTPPPTTSISAGSVTLDATAGSSLTVSYASNTQSVCTVNGSTVMLLSAGECSITASQSGNENYLAAEAVTKSFTIAAALAASGKDAVPTITFNTAVTSFTPVEGSGGIGTLSYSINPTLPAGLEFSTSTGAISGTPTAAAGFTSYTVTVKDSATPSATATKSFSLEVAKASQATLTVAVDRDEIPFNDYAVLSTTGGSGDGRVYYNVVPGSPCAIGVALNGPILVAVGVGTCSVKAIKASSPNYLEATSEVFTVTTVKAEQDTLTAIATPSTIKVDETSELSYEGGSGDDEVSFSVADGDPCEINGTTLKATGAGSCSVTATRAASTNYLEASSDPISITVEKGDRTIDVSGDTSVKVDETITLTATPSKTGGDVSWESTTSAVCDVSSSGVVTGKTVGACSVTATVAASDDYNSATSDAYSITVDKGERTIDVSGDTSVKVDETITLTATPSKTGGDVSWDSSTTDVCDVSSTGVVTGKTAGSCSVTATVAASDDYNSATSDPYSITVDKGERTIDVSGDTSVKVDETITLTATPSKTGGDVSWESSTTDVCDVSSTGVVTGKTAGACSVTATVAASDDYNSATSDPYSITVDKGDQATLTASASPSTIKFGETSTLSSDGGSGDGEVTFSVESGPCDISGTTLRTTGAGSCSVTATRATSANYLEASSEPITVTVGKATPSSLSVTATPASIVVNGTSSLSYAGEAGTGTVSYAVEGPCTLSGSTVKATAIGTCKVTATQPADSNHEKQTATANISIGNTDPVTTEPDAPQLVQSQVKSSLAINSVQFANLTDRLDVLHSGLRSSFDFGLNLTNADTGPRWALPGRQEQAARRAAFGHAADINVEARETALGVSKSAETVVSGSESAVAGWINGTVTYGRQNNGDAANSSRDDFSTGGVTIGADLRVSEDFIAGAAFGYGETAMDVGSNGSKSDSRFGSAMLYGTLSLQDGGFIDMVAGYGFGRFDLARWSSVGSTLLTGERDASQVFGSLRYSKRYDLDGDLRLTPSVRLEALQTNLDAYTETGAVAAALSYDSLSVSSLSGAAGFKLEQVQKLPWGTLLPSLRAEFRQTFDGSYRQNLAYVNTPATTYGLEGDEGSKSSVLIGLGLTAVSREGWSLDMGYDFTADISGSDDLVSHSLQATYRKEF